MFILDFYETEKQRFLENCTQCGLCAEGCPILRFTAISGISPQDIQAGVFEFMKSGSLNRQAYTKAFACMECFKCTADMCPEDLNPMLVNELIKHEYISRGTARRAYGNTMNPDSIHRILASVQVPAVDYRRITEIGHKQDVRYVFFPGCNVYFQPEKILNALDIMDAIGDDYVLLPGLKNCCGDSFFFLGDIDEGGQQADLLVAAIADFNPEAVVLWCPTCLCRFAESIAPTRDVPFQVLSFPQYLAKSMNKLELSNAAAGTVTLHEPCKSAYLGLDREGPREVLRQLPGVTLREMTHHGRETVCCGSGAICWFPESCARLRKERLEEASQTGADRLVTVCHFCNQTFAAEEPQYNFMVTNYINLVAEAMGIRREDKFKKYTRWGNLDQIIKDANQNIAESPFERDLIIETLQAVFAR